MKIKVIITRKYSKDIEALISPFLRDLFALINQHGGYICSETLDNIDDDKEHMIISTWNSLEEWKIYNNSREVNEIRNKIDSTIGRLTQRRVFKNRNFDRTYIQSLRGCVFHKSGEMNSVVS